MAVTLLANRTVFTPRARLKFADDIDVALRQLNADLLAAHGVEATIGRVGPYPVRLLLIFARSNLQALADKIFTATGTRVTVDLPPSRDAADPQVPFLNTILRNLSDAI